MSTHRSFRLIAAPRDLLFGLVADVERYPAFLPMWRRARILAREADTYWTEQEVGLGPIREHFKTRTILSAPERIDITSSDALFRAFRILWTFSEAKPGTRVEIFLRWEVESRLLQVAIDRALPVAARTMVEAFETEAIKRSRGMSSAPGR